MRTPKNRTSSPFAHAAFLALCLALFMTGCNSTSSAPPPDTIPPTVPTNLVTTVVSPAQINLSWTASTDNVGVTGYKVERCQGASCSNFAQIATPTATTLNDTGLTGSTSYSYRVRATDAAGNLSTYSTLATMATPAPTLTAPPNLAATPASSTQINLTWSASTETGGTISGYLVERCSGAGCANFSQIATPTATSYNDPGLTSSTSYSYRVRATDATNNLSPYSSTASSTTPHSSPSAPANLAASAAGPVQINLSWTASTEPGGTITLYLIERCQGAGCSGFAQVGTSATTSFSDTGLTGSTSYSYRVRASDTLNNLGPYSSTATAATATPTLTPPSGLTASAVGPSQIDLSWTASSESGGTISKYLVERCLGAGCSSFAQVGTSTTTSFNDTALLGSTSYTYRVRATDAANNLSPYSSTATATTSAPILTAPSNLLATAASSSQINLTWTASTETGGTISGYLVERCSGAACANFIQIAAPTATAYNNTGLAASTSYSYRVRATDLAGNFSSYSSIVTASTPVSTIAISISPVRAAVTTTQPQAFSATVTGSTNTSVTWSVDTIPNGNVTIGTISANGNYTPPSTAGTHTISATSVADVTKSASASIAVTDLAGVTTYHNDLSRDGANTHEFALTTATVKTATFGKRFSCATDGAIYGQPLWVPNLAIGGGSHNVIFVASSRDSVYAFDADSTPCTTYWRKVLLGPGETWVSSNDVGTGDIQPDIGIIGTPVIDPVTNTIYVVTKSEDNGTGCFPSAACHQRLHALSLIDGSEKFGGPADITSSISVSGTGDGSNAGSVPFNTLRQNQRSGLVLSAGVVYVAWASHGDNTPYHGWVIGFDKSTLQIVATFNANPNGSDSGIWMAGGAPAVDSFGNLYFLTGNGTFDADSGGLDYGDSTVKLSTSGGLSVSSWFTPSDQSNLAGADQDHGSGGAAILVDQPGAPHPRLVIGGGKEGNLFLLDRDNLGGYGGSVVPVDSNAVQTLAFNNGIFATAAFWNNALYLAGVNGQLKTFSFDTTTGKFIAAPTSQSSGSFGFPGSTPSVSALGSANGIVWALDNGQYCTQQATKCGPAVLHAYDATNLATELWNSSQDSADSAGHAVKFTVPTVANGKVYVGTRGSDSTAGGVGELDVYGLKPN